MGLARLSLGRNPNAAGNCGVVLCSGVLDMTDFNAWWDSDVMPSANPFAEGSAAYWAWAGWQAAQRPWQGLTDEDVNRESAMIASKMKLAFHAGMYVAQNILRKKNDPTY